MSDWQERITRETAPAIRAEHELRYRLAAPLIRASAVWADLGCGNGLAAACALPDERPASLVLVDADRDAVERAAEELAPPDARRIAGDLTDAEVLEQVSAALREGGEPRTVTCFEVVEHLASFVPLLEWSGELARAGGATFVVSVPNDAFWSIQNPHHRTSWGEGAFEEFRRLLPPAQTTLMQVALAGSAFVDEDASRARLELAVEVGGAGTVATHFIAAYGPLHAELWRGALVTQTDMLAQRRWERQRENDLALMQKLAASHDAEVQKLTTELQQRTVWFEEWRTYIHELERELDRPLSGVSQDELPEAAQSAEPPA